MCPPLSSVFVTSRLIGSAGSSNPYCLLIWKATPGYGRLIRSGGVDVAQMDPGRCQGITGCYQVVKLIEAENLEWSAHTWSSALNTARQRSPVGQLDPRCGHGLQTP